MVEVDSELEDLDKETSSEQKKQEQRGQEPEPVLDSELIPDLIMIPEAEVDQVEPVELEERQQQERAMDIVKEVQEQKGLLGEKALERRNEVANAVQEMLQVAERNEGIGDQIRQVAQEQNQIQEEAEGALSKAQERKGMVKFLIGPNYSQLKKVEEKIQEHQDKFQKLESLKMQMENTEDRVVLDEEISSIKQVAEEVQEEIKQQKRGFSLFGWLTKAFSR
jgi:hypothetical protein